MSRRRLLASVGAAALTLTLPKFVHAQSLEPAHDVHPHWDELLSHIGMSRQSGSNWLRAWLSGLMHEPEARLRGIVLHGAAGSGKSSFVRSVGGLLVKDGFVVTNERSLLEYAFLGKRLLAWEGQVLGKMARESVIEHCLHRNDQMPLNMVRCETLGGEMISNLEHPNLMHWIETHEGNPRRNGNSFETFAVDRLKKRLPWSDLRRYLIDEREQFIASLGRGKNRFPSMYAKAA